MDGRLAASLVSTAPAGRRLAPRVCTGNGSSGFGIDPSGQRLTATGVTVQGPWHNGAGSLARTLLVAVLASTAGGERSALISDAMDGATHDAEDRSIAVHGGGRAGAAPLAADCTAHASLPDVALSVHD